MAGVRQIKVVKCTNKIKAQFIHYVFRTIQCCYSAIQSFCDGDLTRLIQFHRTTQIQRATWFAIKWSVSSCSLHLTSQDFIQCLIPKTKVLRRMLMISQVLHLCFSIESVQTFVILTGLSIHIVLLYSPVCIPMGNQNDSCQVSCNSSKDLVCQVRSNKR